MTLIKISQKKGLILGVMMITMLGFSLMPITVLADIPGTEGDPFNNVGAGGGGGCQLTDFKSLISCIGSNILNPLVALIMAAALVVFLFGVLKFIKDGDKPEERKKGGAMMMYGIVGFFVMLSVWGLVSILTNSFFSGGVPQQPPIPTIQI